MFLALKEIKKEKTRFLMILLVSLLIAYIVYFLSSLAYGLALKNKTSINYWKDEKIVLSENANRNIFASKISVNDLSEKYQNKTFTMQNTSAQVNSEKEYFDFVILSTSLKENRHHIAPIYDGEFPSNKNEVMISKSILDQSKLSLGDIIRFRDLDKEFKIVAFTEDSEYNTLPLLYIDNDGSEELLQINRFNDERIASAVWADSNFKANGLDVLSQEEFIEEIPGYRAQVLTFALMIISLSMISSLIIGVFMYILTMQKKSIFAVLKVQGYQDSIIIKSVIYQSIIIIVISFGLALILNLLSKIVLPSSVPFHFYWPLIVIVSAFTLLCSLLGSVFSAISILKIDPLDAL